LSYGGTIRAVIRISGSRLFSFSDPPFLVVLLVFVGVPSSAQCRIDG